MDSIQSKIIETLSLNISKKLDIVITEGLALKGFEFNNNNDLEDFIKQNCRCEHTIGPEEEKVFFVNNIPFLLIKYSSGSTPINYSEDTSINISHEISYAYL